ncbi:AraC family transcriptional regulator [Phreatobacter sp.]|uniref:AraC family transcriptional regulator n=1 Tax=Phreatobacter sp. TaxID=1966341 RepID=UPI003F708A2D
MRQPPPLARHVLFETRDLDCARERVAEKFCRHRLDIVGEAKAFGAAHHYLAGSMISLNYITYGADVLIDPGELGDFYLVQIPITGTATIRNGNREFVTGPQTASVLNPHWTTRMTWWSGCRQILVQIRKEPFLDFAAQLIGRRLAGPLTFDPRIDFNRPELKRWRAGVLALFRAAETDQAVLSGRLSSALIEQQLAAALLRAQPHDMSAFLGEARDMAAPGHVRRADRYIRDHADEPLTLTDIADAAGVGIRTLQLAYRSAHGVSPMRALAEERLRRVRYDLMHGDPSTTVTDVALRWGFAHLGRFAAAYRREFGELPHRTLRQLAR